MHPDFVKIQELVYKPNGLVPDKILQEKESQDYGALDFEMNCKHIKFRVGKITPTKIGQFVTLWKRVGKGPILPFDRTDPIDLFVISVRTGKRLGQFVFPKDVLCEKDIVSKDGRGGKRAIRVYPPWDITDSRQAKNTQEWQLRYFFEIDLNKDLNGKTILELFS